MTTREYHNQNDLREYHYLKEYLGVSQTKQQSGSMTKVYFQGSYQLKQLEVRISINRNARENQN